MRVRAVICSWDIVPSVNAIGRAAQRATPIVVVLALYVILGQVIGHVVEKRRAAAVRAACLLFEATETAGSIAASGSSEALAKARRFAIEAKAGRDALSAARVECR